MKTDNGGKKQHPNSRANLRPWKPGQSGNPKGRQPKNLSLVSLVKELLEKADGEGKTEAEALAEVIIREAKGGKAELIKELLDRIDGKVGQSVSGEITFRFVDETSDKAIKGIDGDSND